MAVILQVHAGIYSSSSTGETVLLHHQQQLLTSKFRRQSQNMIKYRECRSRYLEFVDHIVGTSSILPPFCPIELIRDGHMFLQIIEKHFDKYWITIGDTVTKYIPTEAICLNDRELLLKMMSVYNGMFAIASEELTMDKEIVRGIVKSKFEDFNTLEYLPDELRMDSELVLEIVDCNNKYLSGVDVELLESEDFMSKAIQKSIYSICQAGESLLENKEWFERMLKENEHVILALTETSLEEILESYCEPEKLVYPKMQKFADLPLEIRNDKSKMMQVLKINGACLEFVSPQLKLDREITLCAVSNHGTALEFADELFKQDKGIVEKACISDSRAFAYAHAILKEDRDFVMKLLKEVNYFIVDNASKKLRSDPSFCLEYLTISERLSSMLKECPELGRNREFICSALNIMKDPYESVFLNLLDETLQSDKEIVLKCLQFDVDNYEFISSQLKQDKDVLLVMAQHCRRINDLQVAEYLVNDRDFAISLFKNNRFNTDWLEKVPSHYLEEDSMIDLLLSNHPSSIDSIPKEKQLEFIKKYPTCLIYLSNEGQLEYIDLLIELFQKHSNYFDYLEKDMQEIIYEKDKQLVIEACNNHYYTIQHLNSKLKLYPEVALACINRFESAFQLSYIPSELSENYDFLLNAVKSCGLVYHHSDIKDETLEFEALKQCGYFDLNCIKEGTMGITELKELLSKRMEASYSSDFYIPKYFATLDFVENQ